MKLLIITVLLVTGVGCCNHPTPKLEPTKNGCYMMDPCNECCPIGEPGNFPSGGYVCTLIACGKINE